MSYFVNRKKKGRDYVRDKKNFLKPDKSKDNKVEVDKEETIIIEQPL